MGSDRVQGQGEFGLDFALELSGILPPAMPTDGYITVKEAAHLLGRSTRTVRRLLTKHHWDTRLVGNGPADARRVIAEKDVLAHLGRRNGPDNPGDMSGGGALVVSRDKMARDVVAALDRLTAALEAQQKTRWRDLRYSLFLGVPLFLGVLFLVWRFLDLLRALF